MYGLNTLQKVTKKKKQPRYIMFVFGLYKMNTYE